MGLKLFNSLTRKKEEFRPINPGKVSMYVCGMTVYNFCHVGHARVMVFFDLVKCWMEAKGFEVVYVRNITDIDDKIIEAASKKNEKIRDYTDKYITAMKEDELSLGNSNPTHEPRATEYVPEMLDLVELLLNRGHAYVSDTNDINFYIRSFDEYGKLSGKSINQLETGTRVAIDPSKKDPNDFVLWKAAKPEEGKDSLWDSKFGKGRPGWHLECSAMSHALLGDTFDIHGGGIDLQFPHHENEIAQSLCGYKKNRNNKYVNTWMHVGFVTIGDEKMSKSSGNFKTIKNTLNSVSGETLRYFLLKTHYRKPLGFSENELKSSENSLRNLYDGLLNDRESVLKRDNNECIKLVIGSKNIHAINFCAALDDDFNTPMAFSAMFKYAKFCKKLSKKESLIDDSRDVLRGMGSVLGLLGNSIKEKKEVRLPASLSENEISGLVKQRTNAKREKNYELADKIREDLAEKGILLEDAPGGTSWKFIRGNVKK